VDEGIEDLPESAASVPGRVFFIGDKKVILN